MKKNFLMMLALMLTTSLTMMADNDRVINFEQLPAPAQALLKQSFGDKVVLIATADFDDYKVMYQSGEKVEFDKRGNWKDLDCMTSAVPAALIPDLIKAHVKATFPGAVITKIDRNRRGYEVKLSNGLEMEYNKAKAKGTDIKLYGYSTHKVKIRIGVKRYDGVELNII